MDLNLFGRNQRQGPTMPVTRQKQRRFWSLCWHFIVGDWDSKTAARDNETAKSSQEYISFLLVIQSCGHHESWVILHYQQQRGNTRQFQVLRKKFHIWLSWSIDCMTKVSLRKCQASDKKQSLRRQWKSSLGSTKCWGSQNEPRTERINKKHHHFGQHVKEGQIVKQSNQKEIVIVVDFLTKVVNEETFLRLRSWIMGW